MDAERILRDAVTREASDIFIIAGQPVTYGIHGRMEGDGGANLTPAVTAEIIKGIYDLAGNRDFAAAAEGGDDDFSIAIPQVSRFRINIYKQRGSMAAVIRVITFDLPDPGKLGIPHAVLTLADKNTKGLILVTGTAGSGKSTTLSCLIDRINSTRTGHIITLEDPLEYLHHHKKSIVSQREISIDTDSYLRALRASLRQAPKVILLGEMRDYETISVAMTAAETGHLVFSSLHTVGAVNTIDRVIDAFPANQQNQIRTQLSMVLQAVVSQQLIPTVDGNVVPSFEIMTVNNAVMNMIRENKIHQIDSVIYSSASEGMLSMDNSILTLFKAGRISKDNAVAFSSNQELMAKKLG